jgi:hypothetical protein
MAVHFSRGRGANERQIRSAGAAVQVGQPASSRAVEPRPGVGLAVAGRQTVALRKRRASFPGLAA